jgi:hypothetical protein
MAPNHHDHHRLLFIKARFKNAVTKLGSGGEDRIVIQENLFREQFCRIFLEACKSNFWKNVLFGILKAKSLFFNYA